MSACTSCTVLLSYNSAKLAPVFTWYFFSLEAFSLPSFGLAEVSLVQSLQSSDIFPSNRNLYYYIVIPKYSTVLLQLKEQNHSLKIKISDN